MKKKSGSKRDKVWCKSEWRSVKAGDAEEFRKMIGPGALDSSVRNALQLCWMLLPDAQRSPDQVEKVFREVVDRAIRDMREDQARFSRP